MLFHLEATNLKTKKMKLRFFEFRNGYQEERIFYGWNHNPCHYAYIEKGSPALEKSN